MNSPEAVRLIENTFDHAFDESRFTLFVKNLLNDVETKHNTYRGNLIKESFREHIVQYKRIGKYVDPENEALDVLLVEVADQSKLDKARTTLRNFVISHLDNFKKSYALVAFYAKSDGGADWRFSFVKLEYRTEVQSGKIKQEKDLTPAKRYSFLVGEHEKSHTAKKQLLPLLQNVFNNPTLAELEAAFSIEAVTDEFFEQYKLLFDKLVENFKKNEELKSELNKSQIEVARFAKKLLGQIVFLYFLQKKGWLGVSKDAAWGTGSKRFLQDLYTATVADGRNFFGDALQYLFYEALANDQTTLRGILRRERRVELVLEGLRYMDLIRWKLADKALNMDIPGLNEPTKQDRKQWPFTNTLLPIIDRDGLVFHDHIIKAGFARKIAGYQFDAARQYLWPIPASERLLNAELTQNPGY